MKFLVMMPTYNEIETLQHSVESLLSELPAAQVVIIDDSSPDGTGDLADRLSEADERISVIHRPVKQGLGAAYGAGVAWGLEQGFDYLVQMDADGSHRPADLAKMLQSASKSDLVVGSRWIDGGEVTNWSRVRELISRMGNAYTRMLLGGSVRDVTAGFRVYSADLARRLPFGSTKARGYGFQVEMTLRSRQLGATITEVPIRFVEREGGKSKMTFAIVLEAFLLTTKWGLTRLTRL